MFRKFECAETNLKATGQGGSIVYQRLGRIEEKVDNILKIVLIMQRNNTQGTNVNGSELVDLMKNLMKESKEELQLTVKKTIHEMNGFALPPKIQSIHLNVFVHDSKGRHVFKHTVSI